MLLADLAQLDGNDDPRRMLARRYIHGRGIECGALQNPMTVPDDARVTYVDRLTVMAARTHYPELNGQPLTPPNLVADLQHLPVASDRLDLCIGNHLLEHARDPIGALSEFLRTIRPNGIAFVSVPNVDNPLDRGRPVTSVQHLLDDHDRRAERGLDDDRHYDEAVASAHPTLPEAEREGLVKHFRDQAYSIHFHTFDEASCRQFVKHVGGLVGAAVEEYARNRTPDFDEFIAILRRVA